MQKIKTKLNAYFHLTKHKTSCHRELVAAITNYFTLLYIVALVPEVLMGIFPNAMSAEGELMQNAIVMGDITAGQMITAFSAVAFLAAGIGSIIMGLAVNVPFVQGPSLTISTFIVYTVCIGFGYSYYQALAIIFLSGICFFILSITGIEHKLHKAIPQNIKYSVTAGIGLFIAYTGLQKAHIIAFENGALKVFNMLALSTHDTRSAWLAIAGVIFITILMDKHIHGAIFIGKMVCILVALPLGLVHFSHPVNFNEIPFDAVLFKMDFSGLVTMGKGMGKTLMSLSSVLLILFSICLMDIFETMSMLIATTHFVEISAEKRQINERIPKILEIDAVTTSIGAMLGMTNISTYIESTTGVIEGARTGLTAVITGVLFILTAAAAPLAGFVPSAATATTLIIAGVLMMNVIKNVDFETPVEAVPALFTIILMPLTNSLLTGIAFGIIIYVLTHIFMGKGHRINPIMFILAILFAVIMIFMPR